MTLFADPAGPLQRWRASRRRRAEDRRALRSEFELERPRGLAALRALARDVGELEGERIRSHAAAARQPAAPAGARASRSRAAAR